MTDINPYQTPAASVEPPHQKPTNSVWWKAYFWFSAVLMLLGLVFVPFVPGLEAFDYLDLVIALAGTAGLFGFAYYRPIANVVFWRYFFYAYLLWALVRLVIFQILELPRFGELTKLDGWYLFEIVTSIIYFWAAYAYAFKRPFIWWKSPTG